MIDAAICWTPTLGEQLIDIPVCMGKHRRWAGARGLVLTEFVCVPQAVGVAQISEAQLIDELVARLTRSYAHLPHDQVCIAVRDALARFEQSPIREFVPLLVERRARAELSRHAELIAWST